MLWHVGIVECTANIARWFVARGSFGIGPFFAISRTAARWLRGSATVQQHAASLYSGTARSFREYADEIYFGWLVSHCPGLLGIELGYQGRAVHNVDEQTALLAPGCLDALNLSKADLTSGHQVGPNGAPPLRCAFVLVARTRTHARSLPPLAPARRCADSPYRACARLVLCRLGRYRRAGLGHRASRGF